MTAALTDVFLNHRKSLIWSVMRIVRDSQAAEDVAQETFIRARQALEKGPIDHIEAFLHQTAHNLAIDFRRRRELHGSIERDDVPEKDVANVAASIPSPEASLIQSERLRLLDEAIKRLPKRAQTVWYLNRVEKWSYPRIVDGGKLNKDIKPSDFNCAAWTYPLKLSDGFSGSVVKTFGNLVTELEQVPTPPTAEQMKAKGARGLIVVRGEDVSGKIRVVPGFWQAGMDGEVEIAASIVVDGPKGRLLGTTVAGDGSAQTGAGGFCEGGANALVQSSEQALKEVVGRLGEALVNSDRVRKGL